MTINVTVADNFDKKTYPIDDSKVIKNFLDEVQFDYTKGVPYMDGAALMPGDINKSFAEFGCSGRVYLTRIIKTDNAVLVW